MNIQCKNICDDASDLANKREVHVEKAYACNFGNHPWADGRTGKPLLCGTDKDFSGMLKIFSLMV